ncbi:YugN-like family protein [Paenibacillus sp. UNCCL117]|uniref:YugN family protein n=1 Tax=unclassified Paenibacillus TaxID=185978 RepID=UPI00088FBC55|nr:MULTISPECIES: YugN family protein [unclassified Paenibacillus]SDC01813.1 YugN-like family protein [Paenibacillus sp. cl123]SFW36712.1 YugN-like family protein [Paenibacillus sp. UNCCL117]
MVPLDSKLAGIEEPYDKAAGVLQEFEFSLGGNWDYEHGCFDRSLDEGHKVWLRIPFEVTHGVLEGENGGVGTVIQLGSPFVLKHLYNEGLDEEAQVRVVSALFDQFQEPVDKDAPVEGEWVDQAKLVLKEVESRWLQ